MKNKKNTTLSFIIKGSSELDFQAFEVGYIMKQTTYKMETYNKLLYFKWNFVVIRRLNLAWIKAPGYIWSDRWVGISVDIPFPQLSVKKLCFISSGNNWHTIIKITKYAEYFSVIMKLSHLFSNLLYLYLSLNYFYTTFLWLY